MQLSICFAVLFAAACGCAGISEVTGEEPVHVTAIFNVRVIDKTGNPVPNVDVQFDSVKVTGTAPKEGSDFHLEKTTDADGKASFTVGYDLQDHSMGYPSFDSISAAAAIPGDITGGAIIGYPGARERAGGSGTAVISKTITLQIP